MVRENRFKKHVCLFLDVLRINSWQTQRVSNVWTIMFSSVFVVMVAKSSKKTHIYIYIYSAYKVFNGLDQHRQTNQVVQFVFSRIVENQHKLKVAWLFKPWVASAWFLHHAPGPLATWPLPPVGDFICIYMAVCTHRPRQRHMLRCWLQRKQTDNKCIYISTATWNLTLAPVAPYHLQVDLSVYMCIYM